MKTLAVVVFVVALLSILRGWTAVIPFARTAQKLMPGHDFDMIVKRAGLGIPAMLRELPPPWLRKDKDDR